MKIKILLIPFLLATVSVLAQEPEVSSSELSTQQQLIKANREAFKATLTDDQKELLHDNLLTKDQKREAFKASLSEQQKKMLHENKQAIQQHHNLRQNLSNEQKLDIRKDIKKKRERIKRVVRRTRLNSINN